MTQQAGILPFASPNDSQSEQMALLRQLVQQQEEMTRQLATMERRLNLAVVKDTYTTEEAAERLGRRPYTVRQWSNEGQARAFKVRGKGRQGEWRIPHDELIRLQNEGPMPVGTFDNGSCFGRKAG